MKFVFVIFINIFVFNFGLGQINFTPKSNLKGNIKSVFKTSYNTVGDSIKFKKTTIISGKNDLVNYDTLANIIKITEFKPNLETERIISYSYKDNRIKTIHYASNIENSYAHSTYLYDSLNNNYKQVFGNDSLPYFVVLLSYDDKGNNIELKQHDIDDNGYCTDWIKKEYDSANQMIKRIVIDNDSTFRFSEAYEYDKVGNLTKHKWIDANNNVQSYTTYLYDENNLLTTKSEYHKNGLLIINSYYNYEFDENNNWIIQRQYTNSKSTVVTERVITYF